jgi:DNA-binding transcriptional ArsR family regulator
VAESKALKCVEDPGIVDLAEDLKVLSDPNRLRIMCLLLRGERCVCEVEEELRISQQLASHHLNVLKESGFLSSRKEGTSSYYAVERRKLGIMTRTFLAYLDYERSQAETGVACCGLPEETRSKPRARGVKSGDSGR